MRKYINILLENSDEILLYRGDSSKVSSFSTEKTKNSIGLLFGYGIYLTSDPSVAEDYTTKGNLKTKWNPDGSILDSGNSRKELLTNYFRTIMDDNDVWSKQKNDIQRDIVNKYPDISYDEKLALYKEQLKPISQKYIKAEIDRVKKEGYRVKKLTTGEWVLMKPHFTGYVSHFSFPVSYINKTVNGDIPLSDGDLEAIISLIEDFFGDRGDFRLNDDTRVSIRQWCKSFKTNPTRRAWEDDLIGGKNQNPSIDDILNGTHGGISFWYAYADKVIDTLQGLGYVGIEYFGGNRSGQYIRGGGGIQHRAFVFWDDQYVNSRKVDETVPTTKKVDGRSLNRLTI